MKRHIWVVEWQEPKKSDSWSSKGLYNKFWTKKEADRDAWINKGQSREFNWGLDFRVIKYTPDEPYQHSGY